GQEQGKFLGRISISKRRQSDQRLVSLPLQNTAVSGTKRSGFRYGGERNDGMESDKAMAIGKVIALALSPARRLMGQVIAKASVLPVDGRGKSPGSRKTQFKAGHGRLGGRRKTEPDLAKLLDQVCSGVRASGSLKLDALKLKLEELSQALNQQAGTK